MDGGGQMIVGGRQVPIPGGCAFVPDSLPPRVTYTAEVDGEEMGRRIGRAMEGIGGLRAAGARAGGALAHRAPYLAREAVASSRIEGTSTTLDELLRRRALAGEPHGDGRDLMTMEVENNARALEDAMGLVGGGAPIDLGIIRRAHRVLVAGLPQYGAMAPGEFRDAQNWIGGKGVADATYVPPPPGMVVPLMENLVSYIAAGSGSASPLARCAIAHCQFESIHPFPDGNGRVGRILTLLMMKKYGLLDTPALAISRYLLRHRFRYYDMLRAPRRQGGWAQWIAFFADACAAQATEEISSMKMLGSLCEEYRGRLEGITSSASVTRVIGRIVANPYVTTTSVMEATGMGHADSLHLMRKLVEGGTLEDVPAATGTRLYVAPEMMRILAHGD